MSPKNWMIQVFLLGFLCPVDLSSLTGHQEKIRKCWEKQTYVVADNFYGIITAEKHFIAKLEALIGIYQRDPFVVCEGNTAELRCGEGEVIYVREAEYGRRDNTTCSSGKPNDQLNNTQCGRRENVSNSCNGQRECKIKAENSGGNDPCQGIYKYLEVNYICLDANGTALEVLCANYVKPNETVSGESILKAIFETLRDSDENSSGSRENVKAVEVKIEEICKNLSKDWRPGLENLNRTAPYLLQLIINTTIFDTEGQQCLIFLQKNETRQERLLKGWPQVKKNDDLLLYIPKDRFWRYVSKHPMHVLGGKHCLNSSESCKSGTSVPKTCSDSPKFQEKECRDQVYNDKYMMNLTASPPLCINCDNPVKTADEKIQMNTTIVTEGEEIEATKAVKLMSEMGNLISKMNGTSAELSVGKGIEGIIVKQTNPQELDEVSFAYQDPNDKLKIIEDREYLEGFSRSVSIPREAFEKAFNSNIILPFAAVLRFMNLSQDESNSSVLNNEVVAIEMGTEIKNLTDTISINFNILNESKFRNLKKEYEPICRSWNGEGSKPNWTVEGCTTILDDNGVRCRCSHLTFFAVLLTPLNQTISSHDLNILTMITQVGCGFSIFFLGIILFMYFLIRKTKASTATQILIHLICALLLLNLTFLVNHFVADMNSEVGCEVMAAVMHYCMLATFSWFAAQGFHLCLQLHRGGNITIRRYVLKVSVFTWTLPGILVIILGSLGKYGKQTIYTDDPENNVAMCWITDNNIHYVVNIGYYSLVFLFTITTVIIILSWLCCLKKTKAASPKKNRSGSRIVIIMGLCFQLGVTWGFAFFAYGDFRMIANYIFTVLNSFQGFFLFIYYYKTSRVSPNATDEKGKSSSVSTLKSGLENIVNPYVSFEKEKAK